MGFRISSKIIFNFSIALFIISAGFLLLPNSAQATVSFNDEKNVDRWFSNTGSTWTDHGISATGDYFSDSAAVDDAVYFNSYFRKQGGVRVNVGTVVSATNFTCVWEYNNPSDVWVEFSNVNDTTNCFQNTGNLSVTWNMPTDWNPNNYICTAGECGSLRYYTSGYPVRARVTNATGITEGGANSVTTPQTKTYAIWIKDGATHSVEDIYDADIVGGWNVITKDLSEKMYLLNANLIIDNGQLNIRNHETVTVGKEAGNNNEHFNIEINSGGTLQMGEKSSEGYGYNGGTLVWNDGKNHGIYNYWYGNVKMYASRFSLNGYGYIGLSFGCVFDVVDSVWASYNSHTWYITSSASGAIKRTLIGGYYLYVYATGLEFDGMNLGKREGGQNPYGVLSGSGSYFAKISNMDFQDFIRATVTQRASLAIIDCDNFQDSQFVGSGNYTTPEHLHRRFTFDLKVTDKEGNLIENAIVSIKDVDGNSALFEDFAEIYSSTRITDLDSTTDTSATVIDSSRYTIDEYYRVRGEIIKVTAKPTGTTLTVERNLSGTTANGVLGSYHIPYHRMESVQTDSNGSLYYDTDMPFHLTVKDYPRLDNVNLDIKDFNPFTITISADGYNDYESQIEISEKMDWSIALTDPCDPWTVAEINTYAASGYDHANVANYPMSWDDGAKVLTIWGDNGSGGKEIMGYDADHLITMEHIWAFAAYTKGTCIASKEGADSSSYTFKDVRLMLGTASADVFIGDTNKVILIKDLEEEQYFFDTYGGNGTKGNLYFGEYESEVEKTTKNGCVFLFDSSQLTTNFCKNPKSLYLYDSKIKSDTTSNVAVAGTTGRIWQTQFENQVCLGAGASTIDIDNLDIMGVWTPMYDFSTTADFENIGVFNINYVMYFADVPVIIKDIVAKNQTGQVAITINSGGTDHYMINAGVDWSKGMLFFGTCGATKIYRQYEFDLRVVDRDGGIISGATVQIWDKADNLIVDTTTGGDGTISTEILNYGYYDQAHGNIAVMQTPHKIRIHHQNYPQREFEFTLDEKTEWEIALKDTPMNVGSVKVWGTEYADDEAGTIYAQVFYGDGSPCNTVSASDITATVYKSDGSIIINGAQMSYVANTNGIYKYDFAGGTFSVEGVYVIDVIASSTSPDISAYNSNEIHISQTANKIKSMVSDIWSYTGSALDTTGNAISKVWSYTGSSLDTTGNAISKVWSYTGSSLDTTGNAIAKVWDYTSGLGRRLTSRQIGESGVYVPGVTESGTIAQVANEADQVAIKYDVDLVRQATFDFAGFADSGTTLTLIDSELEQPDDYWNDYRLKMMSGSNFGEERTVSDFDSTSDTIIVSEAFTNAISNGDKYALLHEERLVYKIWNYSARTLTSAANVAGDIWGHSGGRTLTSGIDIADDIWNATTRKLTSQFTDEVTPVDLAQTADVSNLATSAELSQVRTDLIAEINANEILLNSLSSDLSDLSDTTTLILNKWDTYAAVDIVGYVDEIESRLGISSDLSSDETIFGRTKFIQEKWGTQTAQTVFDTASSTLSLVDDVQTELGYNGTSTTAFADMQLVKGYVDDIEEYVGFASDATTEPTLFGKLNHNKELIEALPDAIWDETLSDHSTEGSTGAALSSASEGGSGDSGGLTIETHTVSEFDVDGSGSAIIQVKNNGVPVTGLIPYGEYYKPDNSLIQWPGESGTTVPFDEIGTTGMYYHDFDTTGSDLGVYKLAIQATNSDGGSSFNDTFTEADGLATHWAVDGNYGIWNVDNHIYKQTREQYTNRALLIDPDAFDWTDYSFETDIRLDSPTGPSSGGELGIYGRYLTSSVNYKLSFNSGYGADIIELRKGGVLLENKSYPITQGTWYKMKMVFSGNNIKCYVDGVLQIDYTDGSPIEAGKTGFFTYTVATSFDNVAVVVAGDSTTAYIAKDFAVVPSVFESVSEVKSELGYSSTSTTAYADMQLVKNYVNEVEGYIGTPTDEASASTLFGKIRDVCEGLNQLNTLETKLDTIDGVIDSIRASQELDYTVELSDVGEVETTKTYRAKLTVLDYENNPTNASTTPTIIIYDALRATADAGIMTELSTGVYEYTYTILTGATCGLWETVVNVDLGGATPLTMNDYWEVEGSPAQVIINSMSDVTVPSISANVTISNEGNSGYEYQYEWCVVDNQNNQCGGGDDIDYASAAKYLTVGEDWTTELDLTVPNIGDYWFKIVVHYGTATSGASRTFTATEEGEDPTPPSPGGGSYIPSTPSPCQYADVYSKLLEIQNELGYHNTGQTVYKDLANTKYSLGVLPDQVSDPLYTILSGVSSDIQNIGGTKGYNLDNIYMISQTDSDDLKYIINKTAELKAVIDINKSLISAVANQPIIQTWFSEGSIVLNILVINPPDSNSRMITIKEYLPKEIRSEHIVEIEEGLRLEYDSALDNYFVSGKMKLEAGERKTFKIKTEDVFKISEDELNSLKEQAETLMAPLQGTSYFAQASILKSEIDANVDGILRQQAGQTTNIEKRISIFRDNQKDLQKIQENIEALKKIAAEVSGKSGVYGSLFGVSTTMTWAIIIIVVVGIAVLMILLYAILMKSRALEEHISPNKKLKAPPIVDIKKQAGKIKGGLLTYFLPPFGKSIVDLKQMIKMIKILIVLGILILLIFLGIYFMETKKDEIPEATISNQPVSEQKNISIEKNENEKNEEYIFNKIDNNISNESDEINNSDTEIKKEINKLIIIETGFGWLNVRNKPSTTESEILDKVNIDEEFDYTDEQDGWYKIILNDEEKTEGWVFGEYIEIISNF